jgi:hypothetical protein
LKLPEAPPEDQPSTIQLFYSNLRRRAKQHKEKVRAMNLQFEIGDLVLLKANNISSEYDAEINKFLMLYDVPFEVKKRIQTDVYVLMC